MSARATWAGVHVIAGGVTIEGVRAIAEAAIAGGARIVQVRLKGASSRTLFLAASAVAETLRQVPAARLIVNDRLDVALAVEADAVHLGQDDLPAEDARAAIAAARSSLVFGLSTHDLGQARAAERAGAAYIGFGPIFATGSKADALSPRGIAQLAAVCREVDLPVIAIGGITIENAADALAAGAAGIAVISAIAEVPDRKIAVRSLVSLFQGKE